MSDTKEALKRLTKLQRELKRHLPDEVYLQVLEVQELLTSPPSLYEIERKKREEREQKARSACGTCGNPFPEGTDFNNTNIWMSNNETKYYHRGECWNVLWH